MPGDLNLKGLSTLLWTLLPGTQESLTLNSWEEHYFFGRWMGRYKPS